MGWQPNAAVLAAHTAPCAGCPHTGHVHASQSWAPLRKQSDRAIVDPWLTPAFKAAHPGLDRGALALVWLIGEFSGA